MRKLCGVMAVLLVCAIAGFPSQALAADVRVLVTELNNGILDFGDFRSGDKLIVVGNGQLNATGWRTLKDETDVKGLSFSLVLENGQTSIPNEAMRGNTMLTSITGAQVTSVGEWAFSRSGLKSVSMPMLETVQNNAFFSCFALESFYLPQVKIIGWQAFENNTSLKVISLPAATTVGRLAFMNSSSVTELTLLSVENIGNQAFANCTELKVLRLGNADPSVSEDAFEGVGPLSIYSNKNRLRSSNYPAGSRLLTSTDTSGGSGCDAMTANAGLWLLLCVALFLTTLTGPGNIWLQSMPAQKVANVIIPYLPAKSDSGSGDGN